MIDIRHLRESPEEVRAALARRMIDLDGLLDQALTLDRRRRETLKKAEALKAERNRASNQVAELKRAGEDASQVVRNLKKVSDEIKEFDQSLRSIENELTKVMLSIPNVPLPDVPEGRVEANEVLRSWGDLPQFSFEPKPHWDLGKELGVLDLARGAKITGSGFPLFIGAGARLVRALINFMLDLHAAEHGYVEVAPPYLVNRDTAQGTGQLPDHENIMYVTEDGYYLIPTAEVPVTNLHKDEIMPGDSLPRWYASYTACFRREAGAHGRETRGIIRVHQFDKVELVWIGRPQDSPAALEKLLGHAETVLQRLGLPYRVVLVAAGEIGIANAKTYDLEVWAAGAKMWLEVSSVSTFTDFQARRANIRYRPHKNSRPEFVHTVNGSGLALPRTLIALLENNQQEDGSVSLPEALVPYIGIDRITAGDN